MFETLAIKIHKDIDLLQVILFECFFLLRKYKIKYVFFRQDVVGNRIQSMIYCSGLFTILSGFSYFFLPDPREIHERTYEGGD